MEILDLFDELNYSLFLYNTNLSTFKLNEGIRFNKVEFGYLKIFLEDFYNYSIECAEDSEHEFPSSISIDLGYKKYVFLPSTNCKKILESESGKLVSNIKTSIFNKFKELYKNNYVICLHNGCNEMNLGLEKNPIVLELEEFIELNNFIIDKYRIDLTTKIHTISQSNIYYLDSSMQSFFSKKIIGFYLHENIFYTDSESMKEAESIKRKWFGFIKKN